MTDYTNLSLLSHLCNSSQIMDFNCSALNITEVSKAWFFLNKLMFIKNYYQRREWYIYRGRKPSIRSPCPTGGSLCGASSSLWWWALQTLEIWLVIILPTGEREERDTRQEYSWRFLLLSPSNCHLLLKHLYRKHILDITGKCQDRNFINSIVVNEGRRMLLTIWDILIIF